MKFTEVLRRRFEGIKQERKERKEGKPASGWIPTGLKAFDKRGGHKRKQVTLYAGETGIGKSMWSFHLMKQAALHGFRTTVVAMEDPEERTADRAFSDATGINSEKILGGELDDKEVLRIQLAMAESEEWADRVEYFDGVKTPDEVLSLFAETEADQEILDYFSAFPHGKHGRERSISDFVWAWTKHLQENNRAGIGFAQLSPEVTKRGMDAFLRDRQRQHYNQDKNNDGPYIDGFRGYDASDIMWCTDVGRNAKELGFMFRPNRILNRPQIRGKGKKLEDNIMEFDFPKRNWGSEGRIRVGLDMKTARFKDLVEKE